MRYLLSFLVGGLLTALAPRAHAGAVVPDALVSNPAAFVSCPTEPVRTGFKALPPIHGMTASAEHDGFRVLKILPYSEEASVARNEKTAAPTLTAPTPVTQEEEALEESAAPAPEQAKPARRKFHSRSRGGSVAIGVTARSSSFAAASGGASRLAETAGGAIVPLAGNEPRTGVSVGQANAVQMNSAPQSPQGARNVRSVMVAVARPVMAAPSPVPVAVTPAPAAPAPTVAPAPKLTDWSAVTAEDTASNIRTAASVRLWAACGRENCTTQLNGMQIRQQVDGANQRPRVTVTLPNGENLEFLGDPLVFDLDGDGVRTARRLIRFDVDGDGVMDRFTDVSSKDGLLVFDADGDGVSGEHARELFSAVSDIDGNGRGEGYADGFEALAALVKRAKGEGVLRGEQFKDGWLEAAGLAALEKKYGLRMRVGGVKAKAVSLRETGVARIHVSDAKPRLVSDFDGQGNDLMRQDGATFARADGSMGEYEDIWFRAQTRRQLARAR